MTIPLTNQNIEFCILKYHGYIGSQWNWSLQVCSSVPIDNIMYNTVLLFITLSLRVSMSPERFARITQMLNRRQPDLTVCLEQVHKPHNLAAIVRTADAVGVSDVHATWEDKAMRLSGKSATGSQNWVNVHSHETTEDAIAALRDKVCKLLLQTCPIQLLIFAKLIILNLLLF